MKKKGASSESDWLREIEEAIWVPVAYLVDADEEQRYIIEVEDIEGIVDGGANISIAPVIVSWSDDDPITTLTNGSSTIAHF